MKDKTIMNKYVKPSINITNVDDETPLMAASQYWEVGGDGTTEKNEIIEGMPPEEE